MRIPRTERHGVLGATFFAICIIVSGCTPGDEAADNPAPPATSTVPTPTTTQRESIAPARPAIAEQLPYGEVDEKLVYGHFAIPEDMIDPLPAIVMVHDWWGLDEQMRATAERLAGEGYIVLAVDLFAGRTASNLGDARDLEIAVLENPDMAMQNLRQAHDFIANTAGAPRVAIVGYGFGGAWSLNLATELNDGLSASVTYYGQVHDNEEKLVNIQTPLLGLFAQNDRAVPTETVEKFGAALESLEKDYIIHTYPGVRRGFADVQSDNYDASAAADAWQRVVEFLDSHLADESD